MNTTPAPGIPATVPDLEDLRATAKPTALSTSLRELRCFGPDHFPLLEQAADEIERYHGGMLAALAAATPQAKAAPIENLPEALEQAANLAIKFTAAPRDYLGPATQAMKMQAVLGEQIAAAIRALHVKAAPAAAPQVVADERKLPPLPAYDELTITQAMVGTTIAFHGKDETLREYARAAIAATPVQAQELSDAAIINVANKYGISPHAAIPFVRELIAAKSTAQEIRVVANPVEFDGIKTAPVQAQEPVAQVRNDVERASLVWFGRTPPHGTLLYAAPVQPVAAPDGWNSFANKKPAENSAFIWRNDGMIGLGWYLAEDEAEWTCEWIANDVLLNLPAAPAAQGDAETARQAAFKEAIEACYKTVADRAKVRHIGDAAHYSACADAIRAITAKAAS